MMSSKTASSPLPSPRRVVAVKPRSVPVQPSSKQPSPVSTALFPSAGAWWHSS